MILPDKHVKIKKSFLGTGGEILKKIDEDKTVSDLWGSVRKDDIVNNFKKFSKVLSFLYIIDAIYYEEGLIKRKEK